MKNKNVAVLGMGVSGKAASEFLLHQGARVTGIDKNKERLAADSEIVALKEKGLKTLVEEEVTSAQAFDLIVTSPGIPETHPLIQSAKASGLLCIGEIELGCKALTNKALGITGTNGKTTVTLLVTHVLNQCKKKAKALGNVGQPLTKELLTIDKECIAVLELSSYQIESLFQRCLDAAVILNITPDHLDRYRTMENYAKAKCDLTRAVKQGCPLFVEESVWSGYKHLLHGGEVRLYGYLPSSFIYTDLRFVYLDGRVAFILPPSLAGRKSHDLENLLAAFALCSEMKVSGPSFLAAWHTFQKPHHRIELVAESEGVRYYDDSKGTNVDAVIRAVESIKGPIYLIAGGVDKNFPYTTWIEEFKGDLRHIFAIGQAAEKMEQQLSAYIPVTLCRSLEEAIVQAKELAKNGDNVLLSPGCSSYDMFRDYAHRGDEFQRIVNALIQEDF